MPLQQQEDDSGGEDDAEVQQECLHKFSTRDYIMEPSIFNTLKRCVSAVHTQGLRRVLWYKECDLGVEGLKNPPCLPPAHLSTPAPLWPLIVKSHHFALPRYFQAGGSPENVIQLLSENYTAVAQTVNLLAEWLIQTGA